jgi:hypothetical protein
MKKQIAFSLLVTFAFASTASRAYELATHGLLTLRAFQVSKLGSSPALLANLGIDVFTVPQSTNQNPLGTRYIDMGVDLRLRSAGTYEQDYMPDRKLGFSRNSDALKLESWLMRGAIREDDVPFVPFLTDDPVNAVRPLNHFFDPAHNLPLTAGGQANGARLGKKNPDWALGTSDVFANPNAQDASRSNHYAIPDAREAMWRALTLTDKLGAPLVSAGSLTQPEAIRKAYWATTFRALGDAVHLVEDMAQPQHTRNEPHSGIGPGGVQAGLTGHGSVYEKYTDARATGDPFFNVNVGNGSAKIEIGNPAGLPLDGYPTPTFNRYVDFFSTSAGSDAGPGYGMADYSNRRFFTQVKNLGSSDFRLPSNNPADYSRCVNPDGTDIAAKAWDGTPLASGVKVELLCAAQVKDEMNSAQSAINVPLTSKSIWDQFLQEQGIPGVYHLVRENYDAQANLLLPRAVAYSAGLIDYFFRGKLTISPPDEGVYGIVDHAVEKSITTTPPQGFRKIKLKAKNSTADINGVKQDMAGGNLIAVVKFHRNTCYTEDLSGEWGAPDVSGNAKGDIVFQAPEQGGCRTKDEEIVVSDIQSGVSLPAGGVDQPYEFRFATPIPINATDVYLQVVYRGNLGSESDAVAVETRDIGEPSFTAYTNGNDYLFCYNGDWHYRGPNGEFPPELENVVTDYGRYAPAPLTDVKIAYEPYELTPSVNTLVQTAAIAPKTYIRYAALHEVNGNWGISVTSNNSERILWHNLRAIDPGLLINQINYAYDAGTNTLTVDPKARKMTKVRKHYTAYGLFYHFAEGAACSGPYPPDIYDAPALAPVTINGAFGQP